MSEMPTVLLTGASGFIARHIALQLLREGYSVRGSVRSLARGGEVADAVRPHLDNAADLTERLRFVELDLLSDDGWARALEGAGVLVHTASPFPLVQPENEEDLVRPAVDGTLRALRAARAAGVDRVVLTSSIAAVSEKTPPAGRPFDESDWSDTTSPLISAYSKSKTLAERAAWDFVADEAPHMQLTVINPGFVTGPPLDRHVGTSLSLIRRLVRSKDPALPRIGFSCVDVRDIAAMHVRAIATPESIGHRHIGVSGFLWLRDMAKAIALELPERRIVTRRAPDWFVRALGLFDREVKAAVPLLGRHEEISAARARETFGMEFIPATDSVRAGARFLVENGLV